MTRGDNDIDIHFIAISRTSSNFNNTNNIFVFIMIPDPNSPEYIYRHVYQNHKNPVYLVPYSALPENFGKLIICIFKPHLILHCKRCNNGTQFYP